MAPYDIIILIDWGISQPPSLGELLFAVSDSEHRDPPLVSVQGIGDGGVPSPMWSCILSLPVKAQGTQRKRGRKDPKSQGWGRL